MTDKLILKTFSSLQNDVSATTDLNFNSTATIAAIDNTLSRDGTAPNQMLSNLDMNSNHVINLPAPTSNFDAVRLLDITSLGTGGSITVNPLPAGGTIGQILTKNSSTNFDASWATAGASQLTIAVGKTFTVNNTLTLSGTDSTSFVFPSTGGNLVTATSTSTFTNKTFDTAGAVNALS